MRQKLIELLTPLTMHPERIELLADDIIDLFKSEQDEPEQDIVDLTKSNEFNPDDYELVQSEFKFGCSCKGCCFRSDDQIGCAVLFLDGFGCGMMIYKRKQTK